MTCCPCAKNFPDGLERVAGDPTFYCGPRRVGNTILLCGTKEGRFPQHCLVGPNWMCMLATYGLVLTPTLALLILVTGAEYWVASFIVCITGSALLLAFSMTACSDPGIVYRPAERRIPPPAAAEAVGGESGGGGGEAAVADAALPPMAMEEGGVLCGRCDVKRPAGAIHCNECNVCVTKKFDHHCPWTGKCIGEKNIRFFYLFLGCLSLHVFVVGALALMPSVKQAL
ncbi:unnamed protein product [Ectocarpus sp. 6 AP-2014]